MGPLKLFFKCVCVYIHSSVQTSGTRYSPFTMWVLGLSLGHQVASRFTHRAILWALGCFLLYIFIYPFFKILVLKFKY